MTILRTIVRAVLTIPLATVTALLLGATIACMRLTEGPRE